MSISNHHCVNRLAVSMLVTTKECVVGYKAVSFPHGISMLYIPEVVLHHRATRVLDPSSAGQHYRSAQQELR